MPWAISDHGDDVDMGDDLDIMDVSEDEHVRAVPYQHSSPGWITLTAIELLKIFLLDPELLDLLRRCVPEQGISSMAEAQALPLRNFRAGGSQPQVHMRNGSQRSHEPCLSQSLSEKSLSF